MADGNDTKTPKQQMNESALRLAALTVLLDRVGGSLSFTEAEYQSIAERFGGRTNLVVHLEVIKDGARAPEVQVKLLSKPPGNADLVS